MGEQLSLIPPTKPPRAPIPAAEGPDAFDQFWLSYPRKVGRGAARRAWATACKKATPAEIILGLLRYEFSPETKYRPHPSTWLNGERWLDESVDLGADPWGVGEYLASVADQPATGISLDCYQPEAIYPIFVALGWPETWRGSLAALAGWVSEGCSLPSVAEVIAVAVEQHGTRSRLEAFDGLVRARARRI